MKRQPDAQPRADALDHHVGSLIREQRSRDNLTIAAVARSAGVSAGMLSKIENGQASPSLDSLNRLSHALGTRVRVVESGEGRGHIEIHYGSLDELDGLLARLMDPA